MAPTDTTFLKGSEDELNPSQGPAMDGLGDNGGALKCGDAGKRAGSKKQGADRGDRRRDPGI